MSEYQHPDKYVLAIDLVTGGPKSVIVNLGSVVYRSVSPKLGFVEMGIQTIQ